MVYRNTPTRKLRCPKCKERFETKHPTKRFCCNNCLKKYYEQDYFLANIGKTIRKGKERIYPYLKMRFEVFKRDNFSCQYCGRNVKEDKVKIQIDHMIPKSKGGKYSMNNLTTSCEECNRGKLDVLLTKKSAQNASKRELGPSKEEKDAN